MAKPGTSLLKPIFYSVLFLSLGLFVGIFAFGGNGAPKNPDKGKPPATPSTSKKTIESGVKSKSGSYFCLHFDKKSTISKSTH